ncbi:phosphotransferase [Humibacter sp.]|uniref:phosphotransferase n=1 Tax=Humibacter sp. TaxID=1940291 RepID=UPI003F7E5DC8
MASALGCGIDGLDGVHREELEYDAFLAHREVYRLRGRALVDGKRVPWSLIEKTTEGPLLAEPYLLDNGVREFDAYASGLLDDLAPAVRAPRLHGSTAGEDGRLTLLLEEVVHDGTRPLDSESLLIAAHDLGTLAGHWLGRVPDEPWLFTGWIDRHSQPQAMDAGRATLSTQHPPMVARLGDRLPAARRLIDAQPRVRGILEALPHTLCHHDAVGANVFVASGETVLIDWESVGPGPVGADLASLLFSSVRRGDAMASIVTEVLDDAVEAYWHGAREEDRSITLGEVRLGLDASTALRWKLLADLAHAIEHDGSIRRGSLPEEPREQAMDDLLALADLLLQASRRALENGSTPSTPGSFAAGSHM